MRPSTVTAAEPFVSLEEMRAAHAKLLESFPDEEEPVSPDLAPVIHFLERGAASGIYLDSAPARRAAQGMLDYWTAIMHSLRRSAPVPEEMALEGAAQAESSGPSRPLSVAPLGSGGNLRGNVVGPATHYLLASYDPRTVEKLAGAAEDYANSLSRGDQDLLRRICLQLFRLSPEAREAILVSAPESKLLDFGEPGRAAGIVEQLRERRVLRRVDDPAAAGSLALAQDALMRSWPRLRAWIEERRRFRQAAHFWRTHNRDRAALVRGRILEEAHHYPDLDGLEQEFLSAAYSDSRKTSRAKTGWIVLFAVLATASTGFAVLAYLQALQYAALNREAEAKSALLGRQNKEIRRQDQTIREQGGKIETQNGYLEATNQTLTETNRELTNQKEEISRQKDDITLLKDRLAKQNEGLQAQYADLKQQSDKTRGEFAALLPTIQEALRSPGLAAKQRDGLNRLVEIIGARLDLPALVAVAGTTGTLEPGAGLLVCADGQTPVTGTVGFFMGNGGPANEQFLLSPRYFFDSSYQLDLYRIDRPGDAPRPENLITKIPPGALAAGPASDLVAVQLPATVHTRNAVPSAGALTGVASGKDLAIGGEVLLVGISSGTRTGKIRRLDAASGLLFTDRISTGYDNGAPVVTQGGLAVGILLASEGEESRVALLDAFLRKNPQWRFVPAAAHPEQNSLLNGAIVQFIASASQKKLVPQLAELIPKFRALGIGVPDDGILERQRTPSGKSEVRYYNPGDEPLAEEIRSQLQRLLKIDARVSRVNDDSPPEKFIQVSFSVDDLNKAFASPASPKS